MSNNRVIDTALSIIDKNIHLDYKKIAKKIYAETGYVDQDFNKFFAVVTSGAFTLQSYIRKRRLYFAACDLVNGSEKTIVDLSLECGYSDQTSFTRAIKKESGTTPAEIRKGKENIPDVRKVLESHLTNKTRIDAVIEKYESNNMSNTDWNYLEMFSHACAILVK
ncbi:MAG: helix-turn-helix domain-containing protein [Oscillospiraceae bacterium]|nr:helix-turn-helix domain-containing protein [Oscillospiraceae bacterium]